MDAAARAFISESRNVQVDWSGREVRLLAIFKFYTEDFTAHAPSLIAYVNRYRTDRIPEVSQLALFMSRSLWARY